MSIWLQKICYLNNNMLWETNRSLTLLIHPQFSFLNPPSRLHTTVFLYQLNLAARLRLWLLTRDNIWNENAIIRTNPSWTSGAVKFELMNISHMAGDVVKCNSLQTRYISAPKSKNNYPLFTFTNPTSYTLDFSSHTRLRHSKQLSFTQPSASHSETAAQ
jgi:hypothetical protein